QLTFPLVEVESYSNVRLADNPALIALFKEPERPKMIGLLESETLFSWARAASDWHGDVSRLKGDVWKPHYMSFPPKDPADPDSINQTYLGPKTGTLFSTYSDIRFNYVQLKRFWPELPMRRTKTTPKISVF